MRFSAAAVFAGVAAAQLTTTQTELTTVTSCGPEATACPGTPAPPPSNMTTSTIYSTQVTTIISCPVTVVDCPARSTHVKTITVAVGTTVCPIEPTGGKYHNSSIVLPPPTKVVPPPTKETNPPKDKPDVPACPTYSVKTISTSVTTVVPTVIYETVSIPCPGAAKPTGGAAVPSGGAKPSGGPGKNETVIPPPVKAGASSFGASAVFAVVAGVAAFALA